MNSKCDHTISARQSWDWVTLRSLLAKLPVDHLIDLLLHSGEWNSALRRTILIKAAYAAYDGQCLGSLESTIRSALDLSDENINYRDSDSFGLVMATASTVIKDFAGKGLNDAARNLAVVALEVGERSNEDLQDGDYWQREVEELQGFLAELDRHG